MTLPKPIVYVANDSPFSLAVESLLIEADIPYERRALDLADGAAKDPAFLAVNPLGMVPALVEGEFRLSESATIMRYLAASRSKTHWYPTDLRLRSQVDRWLDVILYVYLSSLRFPLVAAMTAGVDPFDSEMHARATRQINWLWTKINEQLAQTAFLAGDVPTIADLLCASLIEFARWARVDTSAHANLERWFDAMSKRQRWTEAFSRSVTRTAVPARSLQKSGG